jgi:hypothetical protein
MARRISGSHLYVPGEIWVGCWCWRGWGVGWRYGGAPHGLAVGLDLDLLAGPHPLRARHHHRLHAWLDLRRSNRLSFPHDDWLCKVGGVLGTAYWGARLGHIRLPGDAHDWRCSDPRRRAAAALRFGSSRVGVAAAGSAHIARHEGGGSGSG